MLGSFKGAARAATIVGLLLAAAVPTAAQDKPLTKVTFSLDFIPLGRHAPWYAAVGAGYFREEGLDVTIIPSQGTAQVLQAVESGLAQFGFVDVPGLVLARAGGSKLKMVSINYQKSPYAIFSLSPGAAITTPKQLEGLKLGSGAGSFTPKIIQGFMTQKGLDPQKLEIANVAPPARANMLLTSQVPAIEFFVMSKPGLEAGAKNANVKLETFLLADHGLSLYSNGVAVTEAYLEKEPDLVKRFVRASLRGWKLALDEPQKAAAYQKAIVPSLNEAGIVAEIDVVRGLAVTPETKKSGLGSFDAASFEASLDFVVKYIGVTGTAPKAQDLYATGFLPQQPVIP